MFNPSPEFIEITDIIINRDEGGWLLTNDPNDPGGVTYAGVPFKNFRDWSIAAGYGQPSPDGFIASARGQTVTLTNLIYEYYHANFWAKIGMDDVLAANRNLAVSYYSCAINCGDTPAVKFLQEALNLIHIGVVTVDGVWGSQTKEALGQYRALGETLRTLFKQCWRRYYADLIMRNADAWIAYYTSGIKQPKPAYQRWKDLRGWLNRVEQA